MAVYFSSAFVTARIHFMQKCLLKHSRTLHNGKKDHESDKEKEQGGSLDPVGLDHRFQYSKGHDQDQFSLSLFIKNVFPLYDLTALLRFHGNLGLFGLMRAGKWHRGGLCSSSSPWLDTPMGQFTRGHPPHRR